MIKLSIAIIVAVAILLGTVAPSFAATGTPRITAVSTVKSGGMDWYSVSLSNGKSGLVAFTALNTSDNPVVGALTSYSFQDGWFSDGAACTQGSNSFYINF